MLGAVTYGIQIVVIVSAVTSVGKVIGDTGIATFDDLVKIGILLTSGFCGGLIRVSHQSTPLWPNGAMTVVSSGITAVFLWPFGEPLFADFLGPAISEPLFKLMFGGFIVGLLGTSLVGFILDFFSFRRAKVLESENDDR